MTRAEQMSQATATTTTKVSPAWPFSIVFALVFVCWYVRQWPWLFPELWPVFLAFVVVPVLDWLVGIDAENPQSEAEERHLSSLWRYRVIPCLWFPFALGILADILPRCSPDNPEFSWPRSLAAILSLGIGNGAIGINIAHELIHKNGFERLLGRGILVLVCYGHWEFEHISGHHKRVATPKDPATAKRGQSFYSFWWQSVVGTLQSGWALEAKFCSSRNLPFWMNRCLHTWLASALLGFVILFALGPLPFLVWLGQSFVSFSLLELVNYIEHFGLTRQSKDGQKFEAVRPAHSWDSGYSISNYLLFKLQRHADHHTNPQRRYQILRLMEESPKMPYGYPTMILAALIPPLFFRIVHPILDEYTAKSAAAAAG